MKTVNTRTTRTAAAKKAKAKAARRRAAALDASVAVVGAAPVVAPAPDPDPKPAPAAVFESLAASARDADIRFAFALSVVAAMAIALATVAAFLDAASFTGAESAAVSEFLRLPEDYTSSVSQAAATVAATEGLSPSQQEAYARLVAPRMNYIRKNNPPRLWHVMAEPHGPAIDALMRVAR